MKNKINLVTMTDITEFVRICEGIEGRIELFCGKNGYRVNARSILGCLAALEFDEMWIDSDEDIYDKIEKFIVVGEDGNYIHE